MQNAKKGSTQQQDHEFFPGKINFKKSSDKGQYVNYSHGINEEVMFIKEQGILNVNRFFLNLKKNKQI